MIISARLEKCFDNIYNKTDKEEATKDKEVDELLMKSENM